MKRLSTHILEVQNSLLKVENIFVCYGKSEVIKGVSCWVGGGEVVSLIGANGAGKTTILRTIAGFKIPTSGEIWFDGKRIDGLAPHQIAKVKIGHILEGRKVFPDLTVKENLEVGGYLIKNRNEEKQIWKEFLDFFPRLKERMKQKAGTLSGGEQQMLVTARAMMNRPKLLLMDEPSAGLSPLMVQEIGNIIKHISQQGTSVLLVEQNSYLAFNVSQRVCVLEIGKLILEGKPMELARDDRVQKAYLGA